MEAFDILHQESGSAFEVFGTSSWDCGGILEDSEGVEWGGGRRGEERSSVGGGAGVSGDEWDDGLIFCGRELDTAYRWCDDYHLFQYFTIKHLSAKIYCKKCSSHAVIMFFMLASSYLTRRRMNRF